MITFQRTVYGFWYAYPVFNRESNHTHIAKFNISTIALGVCSVRDLLGN